ncbi:MAG: acyl-CoA synthetase [Candidatus Hydrogenedentota bacterium]
MEPGVQLGDVFVPHAEVMANAMRAARGYVDMGLTRGDSIALFLRNDVPFIEATLGARHLGMYPVPMNWHLKGEEAEYILRDSGARALIIHEDLLPQLKGHVPDGVQVIAVPTPGQLADAYGLEANGAPLSSGAWNWREWLAARTPWDQPAEKETASIVYTSGTTGRQKGVKREPATPEQFQRTVQAAFTVMGIKQGVRSIIPAPLYHSAPNFFAIMSTILATYVNIMPRFDAEEFLALIEKFKITHIQMVPVMFIRLLKLPEEVRKKYDVSSLEHVVHAAAPCPAHVKQAMMDWWGPVIHEYYGSTELGMVTYCTPQEALTYPGTVGRATDGSIVKIMDAAGNELAPGNIGTVYGRLTWNTDFTYQNDPAKRASIEKSGLWTGGDVGYLNEDGFLFLCDRANDMVISGGVNIYPAEIEAVLIRLDGVKDCAVFGIPDEEFGEALAAVVELQDGAQLTKDEVAAHLREHLASYKVPKVIEFQKDLPREDSGKLFKRKLRQPYWEKAGRNI